MAGAIDRCRLCGNDRLVSILHLGQQALTGVFLRDPAPALARDPLELFKCHGAEGTKHCGLVQLGHSFDLTELYGVHYGYRSSLNKCMVRHLSSKIERLQRLVSLEPGDLIVDIGSNDATLLKGYPPAKFRLVGIDPTGRKFHEHYPPHVELIPEFFSAGALRKHTGGQRARVVTSIAMFYDLEDPQNFVNQIAETLAPDGIWMFEQSYLPLMLERTAYDTVCHEHLEYYALEQVHWMMKRADLKIIDVEFNDVNGGSFCVIAAPIASGYPEAKALVDTVLESEAQKELSGLAVYDAFKSRVHQHRDVLLKFLSGAAREGKSVFGYGASTKGNVLLQFCRLSARDIPMIADVNEDKFGCFTPGTHIPIVSEADARARCPDYFLVLPWHFRNEILRREGSYVANGGALVFPLPELEVVDSRNLAAALGK